MKYEQNGKIEELLNGYIDGELSAEERSTGRTAYQRKSRNSTTLTSTRKMQDTCKLVAPCRTAGRGCRRNQRINSQSFGRRDRSEHIERRQGERHLFIRQALAASIIIGLVGILGAVIYKIVGP